MGKKLEVMVVVGGLLSLLLAKVQNNQTIRLKTKVHKNLMLLMDLRPWRCD